MTMFVLPARELNELQQAIVAATQRMTDLHGTPMAVSTIPSATLKTAALIAAQIATGVVVWPGDETMRVPAPRRVAGYVEHDA